MKTTAQRRELPYHVLRSIRKYAPALRAEITAAVEAKMTETGRSPTAAEIGECAAGVVFGDGTEYDVVMENLCLEAYHAGKCRPLREVIDELRASSQS